MTLPTLRVALCAALCLTLSACAATGRVRHQTPQQAFERGMAAYERRDYDRAIQYFRGTIDYGRTATNDVADDAQLMLGRAYVKQRDYILAANEFSRFSELYRDDPRAADAEYERALAYAALSPSFELDQSNAERALTAFQLYVERFPGSPRSPDAEAQIRTLRDQLAHKLFASGGLYERRGLDEAAALTYERAFALYPDASYADDALAGAVRAYTRYASRSVAGRQAERYQKAMDNYLRLSELFPQSPLRPDAELLYDRARAAVAGAPTAGR